VLVSDAREIKADFKGMGSRRTDEELAKLAGEPDPATLPRNNAGMSPERMKIFMDRVVGSIKRMNFLLQEGAALMVDNSFEGSGGTVFVAQASVAQEVPKSMEDYFAGKRLTPQQKESESKMLPQMTMASEHYNRLVRMIKLGEKLK